MLYYDRIDISEGIDVAKSNNSKQCVICHYFFLNHRFEIQYYVCTGCHDLSMLCLNISDIAIITFKNVDYCCIMYNISKSEVINLLEKSVLEDRDYTRRCIVSFCFVFFFFTFLFSIYKMVDFMDVYKSLNISSVTVMKNEKWNSNEKSRNFKICS